MIVKASLSPEGCAPIKKTHRGRFFPPQRCCSAKPQLGRTVGIPVALQNMIMLLQWSGYGFLQSYRMARTQKLLLIEFSMSIILIMGMKFYSVLNF